MNLNYVCCGEIFITMPTYLHHLKMHETNISCYLKCNICGNSSINWPAFRKHNYRYHKNENPIELFDTYNIMFNSLNLDDDIVIDDSQRINEIDANFEVDNEVEEELTDFENKKMNFAQYLLDMTHQHKLTAKTVDSLNNHTKHLFVSFINDLKVNKTLNIVTKLLLYKIYLV
jgi:hypothetical protein